MAIRIPWDKYEVAILIDASIKVINNEKERKIAIKEVSQKLRQKAINIGIIIDDIYRNENGISMQMNIIISLIQNKTSGLHNASKLFTEVVNLYHSDIIEFQELLKEANNLSDVSLQNNDTKTYSLPINSVKLEKSIDNIIPTKIKIIDKEIEVTSWIDLYIAFMSEANNISASYLENRYKESFHNVTYIAKAGNMNLLHKPVHIANSVYYLETDIPLIKILDVISTFCAQYRIDYNKVIIEYTVKPNFKEDILEDNNSSMNDSTPMNDKLEYSEDISKVSFFSIREIESIIDIRQARPTKIKIFNLSIDVITWTDLFVALISELIKYTSASLNSLCNKLLSNKCYVFVKAGNVNQLVKPIHITNTVYYIETDLTYNEVITFFKAIHSFCNENNINKDTIIIYYQGKLKYTFENTEINSSSLNSSIDINLDYNNSESIKPVSDSIKIPQDQNKLEDAFSSSIVEDERFEAQTIDNPSSEDNECNEITTEKTYDDYQTVLQLKFRKGFRLNSALDLRKFKAFYKDIHNDELHDFDNQILSKIKSCGITYDDKLYLLESLLSDEVKDKLFIYIDKSFNSGITAIYYNALYQEFQEEFSCERIFDSEMLRLYLQNTLNDKYYFTQTYMSKEKAVQIDVAKEIKKILMHHGTPVLTDDICKELSHIPQDKIRQAISINDEFIRNAKKGEYFHSSLINLSQVDIDNISSLINKAIIEKEYISGNELLDAIQIKYPHIIENNAVLSRLGLRESIAYTLKNKYTFNGNVISKYGEYLSMSDVYVDFSKNKDRFTLDELKLLKNEIQSGVIYFESVYANSLRISEDTFVSRKYACFDITSTDAAIAMFMNEKEYLPLKAISSFGSFPYAGFPWNIFLLEHYVADFSDKYKLLHTTFNETNCVGAIVKKSANISTYDELIAVALADSDIDLSESNVLSYLCDNGYIVLRRYRGTASAIMKAKEIRNKKGKN